MSRLRLLVAGPLAPGQELNLPEGAARHVQVRRLQPGAALLVFDGAGAEFQAEVLAMGRREVRLRLGAASAARPELRPAVTLAFGMPANERMDALVEKATELGVARLQPLMCERSVLRLDGERADRRSQHWQAVAVAACEQCGRAHLPTVLPVRQLAAADGLAALAPGPRLLLSTAADARPWPGARLLQAQSLNLLSGPEGGLSEAEEARARAAGFLPVTLGPRVLRADTAPLAALAWIAVAAAAEGGLPMPGVG